MYGPQAAFFSELFGTKSRYTGVWIGSQLASLVAGAPAPLIALALLGSFEDPNPTRVSLYLLACAVITVVAVFSYGETRTRDLAEDNAVVPKASARRDRLTERSGAPRHSSRGAPSGRLDTRRRRPGEVHLMRVHDPDRRNLLEGKVALVTGGGGSLGLATARLFLKEGARVVLADRNAGALRTALSSLDDVKASSVVGDATVEADVAAAVDTVVDRHGRLDVLVANAGTSAAVAPVTELDVGEFDRTLAVLVRGVFLACKHGLRVLGDGGSVVIVSGVAGLRAEAGWAPSAAAQHAQVGLMRAVAKEAAGRSIRVNTVRSPGQRSVRDDVASTG